MSGVDDALEFTDPSIHHIAIFAQKVSARIGIHSAFLGIEPCSINRIPRWTGSIMVPLSKIRHHAIRPPLERKW